MADNQVPPICLALLIADHVHTDPTTGKKTILGIFNGLAGADFPVTHPHMVIYSALTGGHGTTEVSIVFVDAAENHEPIGRVDFEIEFSNPIAVKEIAMDVKGLTFPEPGEYRIQLHCSGELLIERRIMVVDRDETSQQGD